MISSPLDHKHSPSLRWIVLSVAGLANFLDLCQSTMVLFGLQDIMQDASMNFTPNTINWVIVAYTITFATFLGIAGYMGDRLGPRLIFVVGSLLLAISNAICAWGTNQSSLLAGRALAGIGAALTTATGIPVISNVFSKEEERNTGLTIYVSIGPVGTVIGVILGAVLTSSPVGWRSMFWVIFILAMITLVAAILVVPQVDHSQSAKTPVDYVGLGAFTAGTCLLIYGLNDAENRGWDNAAIIATLVVGGLLLVGFLVIEAYIKHPFIPREILRNPRIMSPIAMFMFTGGGWVTWFFIATQICLNSLGYSPIRAACYFLPATVAAILGGAVGNQTIRHFHPKYTIIFGFVIGIGALIPWAFIAPHFGIWFPIVFAILYLVSSPPIVVAAQAIIFGQIQPKLHGTASALMYVMYQFGSSLFLAVANIVIGATSSTNGLLVGYRNAMWSLIGFMGLGLGLFLAMYMPLRDTLQLDTESSPEKSESEDVSHLQ